MLSAAMITFHLKAPADCFFSPNILRDVIVLLLIQWVLRGQLEMVSKSKQSKQPATAISR